MPPAFITCAGWGDWMHAVWANEYFTALLNDGVPNVEMHIYARGHHPGDKVGPDEPPATGGLTNTGGISYGTWSARFLDWFRDLVRDAERRCARRNDSRDDTVDPDVSLRISHCGPRL